MAEAKCAATLSSAPFSWFCANSTVPGLCRSRRWPHCHLSASRENVLNKESAKVRMFRSLLHTLRKSRQRSALFAALDVYHRRGGWTYTPFCTQQTMLRRLERVLWLLSCVTKISASHMKEIHMEEEKEEGKAGRSTRHIVCIMLYLKVTLSYIFTSQCLIQ